MPGTTTPTRLVGIYGITGLGTEFDNVTGTYELELEALRTECARAGLQADAESLMRMDTLHDELAERKRTAKGRKAPLLSALLGL